MSALGGTGPIKVITFLSSTLRAFNVLALNTLRCSTDGCPDGSFDAHLALYAIIGLPLLFLRNKQYDSKELSPDAWSCVVAAAGNKKLTWGELAGTTSTPAALNGTNVGLLAAGI